MTMEDSEVHAEPQPYPVKQGDAADEVSEHLHTTHQQHVEHGLLACCSRAGKKRVWAIEQLRLLAEREGGTEAIEDALGQWKAKTADFVREQVLQHEEEEVEEVAAEDLPGWAEWLAAEGEGFDGLGWLDVDQLSPLLLQGSGLALATSVSIGVIKRLATHSETDFIDELEGLDLSSLAELASDLGQAWFDATVMPPDWPIRITGLFPTPRGVVTLERIVRKVKAPSRSTTRAAKRKLAISALGKADLPAARRMLLWMSSHLQKDDHRVEARKLIDAYCEANEVSIEEYHDLSVSDFGLDARGGRDFDYGARTIRLSTSGRELTFVDESTGKSSTRMPKGSRKDDTDKAAAAQAAYKIIGKPLKAELVVERQRFENAMIKGRSWSKRFWVEHILGHPLLGAIARGLVWEVRERGELEAYASMDEEGQLIDLEFEPVTLGAKSTLSIPHPVDMDEGALEEWSEHMLEFEVIQPFDQVGRTVYEPDADARATLDRIVNEGPELSIKALEAIEARGLSPIRYLWGAPRLGGNYTRFLELSGPDKDAPKLHIEFASNGGFGSGARYYNITTTPFGGFFYDGARTHPRGEEPVPQLDIEQIPPRLFSEAMALLHECVDDA